MRTAVSVGDRGTFVTGDSEGMGADILYVEGTWTYDTDHEGWNELHPIKHVQRIGTWTGKWGPDLDPLRWRSEWQEAVRRARSDETRSAQREGRHAWSVHPCLDGA